MRYKEAEESKRQRSGITQEYISTAFIKDSNIVDLPVSPSAPLSDPV